MTIKRGTLGYWAIALVFTVAILGILAWAMATALLSSTILPSSNHDWMVVSLQRFLVVLFAFLFFSYVAYIMHELGHLFAALAMKLHVQHIAILPLFLERVRGNFRVRLYDPKKGHPLGYVFAFPVDTAPSRLRMATCVAAGPGVNLLTGVLCCIFPSSLAVAFPTLISHEQSAYWLHFVASFHFFIAITSLIPMQEGQLATDGKQLLDYLRGETGLAESNRILSTLGTIMFSGTRPSAWNAEMVERMLALRDGSPNDISINFYAYYHALDHQQFAQAGTYLDQVVAQYEALAADVPAAILLEKAYFEAFHRGNVLARAWVALVAENAAVERHTRLRAEAAVLFVEGYFEEAGARAESALAEVPKSVDRGGSLAEAEWLQTLLTECQKHLIPKSDRCSEVS
jgi:hypothetical protein